MKERRGEDLVSALSTSRLITELFGDAESFLGSVEVSSLEQVRPGLGTLKAGHNLRVATSIADYFAKSQLHSSSFLTIDPDVAELLGLLHSLDFEDWPIDRELYKSKQLLSLVELLQSVNSGYIPYLTTRPEKFAKKHIHNLIYPSKEDFADAGYVKKKIRDALGDDRSAVDYFHILFFFDLYCLGLEFLGQDRIGDKSRRGLAYFLIKILPLVIGSYKFSHQSGILRDAAFRELAPKVYEKTVEEVAQGLPSKEFLDNVGSVLREVTGALGMGVHILHRKKSMLSALVKAREYRVAVSDLWDLYGYRVVIDSEDSGDCFHFASEVQARIGRWADDRGYSDYIERPKRNGYRSLHVVVAGANNQLVEIQIRTNKMNHIAEFGTASHHAYKLGSSKENLYEDVTDSVRKGRLLVEEMLKENGLDLNAFIEHLGPILDYVPLSHYYELIGLGKYDVQQAFRLIALKGKKE